MTPDDLRDLLRHARATSGLSQVALAEKAGLDTQRIFRYEAGEGLGSVAAYLTALEATGIDFRVRRPKCQRAEKRSTNSAASASTTQAQDSGTGGNRSEPARLRIARSTPGGQSHGRA